jgi:hypothetical protein
MESDSCPRRFVVGCASFLVVEDKNEYAQAAATWQAGVGGWGGMFSWKKRA